MDSNGTSLRQEGTNKGSAKLAERIVDTLNLGQYGVTHRVEDGQRWWNLREMLRHLGYTLDYNPPHVEVVHKRFFTIETSRGQQSRVYLSDSGMIRFLVRSDKKSAQSFRYQIAEAQVVVPQVPVEPAPQAQPRSVPQEPAAPAAPRVAESERVLDPVDFHGQRLTLVDRRGEPYVAMRPIVEGMGLDWKGQHAKLTSETSRFCVEMITMQLFGDSQVREFTCIPLQKLAGWLMTLQPSRMDMFMADKVRMYQNECDTALWNYWTKGVAVNPRAQVSDDPTKMGLPDFRDPRAAAVGWIEQYDRAVAAELEARAAKERAHLLAAKLAEDAPLVDFAERMEASPTTHLVGAVAKMIQQGTGLSMGQNRLFEWLRENRYLHQTGSRTNQPTQRSLDQGWFMLQVRNVDIGHETRVKYTTRVTGKGLLHFYEQFYRTAIELGLKPRVRPDLVTSAEVLRQLPLWADEDSDRVDEDLLKEAKRLDPKP